MWKVSPSLFDTIFKADIFTTTVTYVINPSSDLYHNDPSA
jgi:hypothetical protein